MHPFFRRVLKAYRPLVLRGQMLDGTSPLAVGDRVDKPASGAIKPQVFPCEAAHKFSGDNRHGAKVDRFVYFD